MTPAVNVSLRPEQPSDGLFIRNLVLETVAIELEAAAWPEPMRTNLLEMQYAARRHARLQSGESFIVESDGASAGWVILRALPDHTHLIEIMIVPAQRGKGIGSTAIRGILSAAASPVRLTVHRMNPGAIRLYERLGFRRTGEDDVQFFMEYQPNI